jgi:hypothetical protein
LSNKKKLSSLLRSVSATKVRDDGVRLSSSDAPVDYFTTSPQLKTRVELLMVVWACGTVVIDHLVVSNPNRWTFFLLVTSTVGIGHEESQNAPVFRGWRAGVLLLCCRAHALCLRLPQTTRRPTARAVQCPLAIRVVKTRGSLKYFDAAVQNTHALCSLVENLSFQLLELL